MDQRDPESDQADADSKKEGRYIYGTVNFTDIFFENHITDFCRVYEVYAAGTEGFPDCPVDNGERKQRHHWYYWIFPVE
jgi:hypothetical protein